MTSPDQPAKRPGRPRKYLNAAERARAWRAEQKRLIAEAQATVEKVVREKGAGNRERDAAAADPGRIIASLATHFSGYSGAAEAKRIQTNLARASSSISELVSLAKRSGASTAELRVLTDAVSFLERLAPHLGSAKRQAKAQREQLEAEHITRRRADLAKALADVFGPEPDPAKVLAMGQRLLDLSEDEAALARHFRVQEVLLVPPSSLIYAVQRGDVNEVAEGIALTRLEQGMRGSYYNEGRGFRPGWQDLEPLL